MSSKRNEKDTLVQINKTTDDPIEGKTKDENEKKNQHPSTSKEKPSIEVLKQIFQEIDINNDETLQKSEIKKAAMISDDGSLISKYISPKVFLSNVEKIFGNKLSSAQDGINFKSFCKIFFIEQKKINTRERRRLGEDFLDAVYKNNSLFVKDIYNQGVDVDYKDKHGTNALLISSFKSYTEICKYLIQVAKVNVNARNKDGTTALHNVCENGNEKIVKLLIKYDARMDIQDKYDGKTPLECAAYNGYYEICRYLVANGANVNKTNKNRSTPLISAAYGGHKLVVKLLLDNGGAINHQDKWGYTALHYAAYNSHLGVTRVLLLNNANGSIKTHKKKLGK